MSLASVLKAWMAERNWEQKDVVLRSGGQLTQSALSYILSGATTDPRRSTLEGLARAFGVSVSDLLRAADGAAGVAPAPPPLPVDLAGLDPAWVADFLQYGHRLTARQREILLRLARELAASGEPEKEAGEERPRDQRFADGA